MLRNPLRPFPAFPHPIGQAFSPLDAKTESVSVETIEELFAEAPAVQKLAADFGLLLGDAERGCLAIKKALNNIFEGRLRVLALKADPPENHGMGPVPTPANSHPIDRWMASKLGIPSLATNPADSLWHLVELYSLAVGVVIRSVAIGIRFGQFSVIPRTCRLLVLNAWPEKRWITIMAAFHDHAGLKDEDIIAEVNPAGSSSFKVIPTIDPTTQPVPLPSWIRDAVWGSMTMAFRAVMTGTLERKDSRVIEAANQTLRMVNRSLDARRLTGAVSYEVCVDNVEYDPRHILVAALGAGRMARWPHSVGMDSRGAVMSYLGYDQYLDGGTCQYRSHRHTWLRSAQGIAVGMWQHDQHFSASAHVRSDLRQAIEARLNDGKQMIILFGPSDLAPIWPAFRNLALTAIDTISGRSDYFLVVKPKFDDELYRHVPEFETCENVVSVRYEQHNDDVCPTGYLIEKSYLTLALTGSPIIESLTQGKACFSAFPAIQETPLREQLVSSGVLYKNVHDMGAAMTRYLDDPHSLRIPFDWFRENLDPYNDNRALERIADAIFSPTPACLQFSALYENGS